MGPFQGRGLTGEQNQAQGRNTSTETRAARQANANMTRIGHGHYSNVSSNNLSITDRS